jgi:hypothetical protein
LLNTGRQRSLPFHDWLAVGYIDKFNSVSPYAKYFLHDNEDDSTICRYCGSCMKASLRLWVSSSVTSIFSAFGCITFTLIVVVDGKYKNSYLYISTQLKNGIISYQFNCLTRPKRNPKVTFKALKAVFILLVALLLCTGGWVPHKSFKIGQNMIFINEMIVLTTRLTTILSCY